MDGLINSPCRRKTNAPSHGRGWRGPMLISTKVSEGCEETSSALMQKGHIDPKSLHKKRLYISRPSQNLVCYVGRDLEVIFSRKTSSKSVWGCRVGITRYFDMGFALHGIKFLIIYLRKCMQRIYQSHILPIR